MAKRSPDRERFLADVIVTAVEGGIGYWSQVSDYRWWSDLIGGHNATAVFETSVIVYPLLDDESGYSVNGVPVGIDSIARAIERIKSDRSIRLSDAYLARILIADRDNDAGNLDSDDADVIVQVAVLGDVIYG
jgi:hypothetical protein